MVFSVAAASAGLAARAVSFAHGAGYGGARFGYSAASPYPVAAAPVALGYAGHGNDIDYYVSFGQLVLKNCRVWMFANQAEVAVPRSYHFT